MIPIAIAAILIFIAVINTSVIAACLNRGDGEEASGWAFIGLAVIVLVSVAGAIGTHSPIPLLGLWAFLIGMGIEAVAYIKNKGVK